MMEEASKKLKSSLVASTSVWNMNASALMTKFNLVRTEENQREIKEDTGWNGDELEGKLVVTRPIWRLKNLSNSINTVMAQIQFQGIAFQKYINSKLVLG